jgi:hypothetical protein
MSVNTGRLRGDVHADRQDVTDVLASLLPLHPAHKSYLDEQVWSFMLCCGLFTAHQVCMHFGCVHVSHGWLLCIFQSNLLVLFLCFVYIVK